MILDSAVSQEALEDYFREGEQRASTLANRGPIRFTKDGVLHPDIVEAYRRTGLYVFEGVFAPDELAELKTEFLDLLDRAPVEPGAPLDRKGRPALGSDRDIPVVWWTAPLGDPFGGTATTGGRYQAKMIELTPADSAPAEVVYSITSPLQFSDPFLRAYGHPGLLAVAAAINGDDFVPFMEGFIIKKPGEGCAFAWHQDGTTHWGSPGWDSEAHGFNYMAQLYPSTAANGLWYVPGSHAAGKVDIKAMVARPSGNLLPEAVPLVCRAGDVAMSNRQLVHGSFPNITQDWRVTFSMGFHRRRSVEGAQYRKDDGSVTTYDADCVARRARMIGYAVAARRQRFSAEVPFSYRPQAEADEHYEWNEAARAAINDCGAMDLRI